MDVYLKYRKKFLSNPEAELSFLPDQNIKKLPLIAINILTKSKSVLVYIFKYLYIYKRLIHTWISRTFI